MKIILGRQIEEVKKKDSENEKNLLKNRNSDESNEVDIDFHSNSIKNIKLGTQLVNRIYLNNIIIYDLEKDTILLDSFQSLVPKTATSIIFDKLVYQDITNYNLVGYCDVNNHIAVYHNNTEYLVLNIRNAVIYAPDSCSLFLYNYTALTHCIFHYFDTSNVISMLTMFGNCSNLRSLDLSNFNTSNVNNMAYMFYKCINLTSLDVSNFNTSKVTDMSDMFYDCNKLTSLDVSSFDTSMVKDIMYMFHQCSNLKTIISNTFSTVSLSSTSVDIFYGCNELVGGKGTTYSSSRTTVQYARVDGNNGLLGYFTAPTANN